MSHPVNAAASWVHRVALGAILAGVVLLLGCQPGPPPRSLLLLITVDTLRADRIGAYGSELGLTPQIDALAAESIVFEAAYAAAALTLPSVVTLLTGRYPEDLGIWSNESALPETVPTLATQLRELGWSTGAVVGNFVLRRSSGVDSGFQQFDDAFEGHEAVRNWPERVAADATDSLLSMLDGCMLSPASRCFLWIHFQDPHGPYTPPAGLRERYLEHERDAPDAGRELEVDDDMRGLGTLPSYQFLEGRRDVGFYRAGYYAEIRYMDEQVGRLMDGVRERDLDASSVVVFAADHGEALGEDEYWFAHGEHLTDSQVWVPLMLRVPGEAPHRRGDLVSLTDVYPTLLALAGDAASAADARGRDLLAEGAAGRPSTPYLATLGGSTVPRYGFVEGEFKFTVSERDGIWDGRLVRLGREGVNLAAGAPQLAAAMRARLAEIRAGVDRPPETRQELSPTDREQLEALGYGVEP